MAQDCCIDHDEAHALLCELFDEDITAERKEEIRAIIRKCPDCFRQLGREEEIRSLVKRCNCADRAPESLRQRIVQTISISYTEATIYRA
ncbi:anti-sigma factor [Corynebacterium aquatimens]|uniref:Mycothiol system anti-sigma-R factor n=1 Tax=Corynebacterium aquatimens TaxID=1190508 RepID=A0A931DZW9_9CORY|nr:anti-sigma factor [Corynebacterium aquatimens]MBG6123170.1 mycothiol system anti-sigma-R factor [Corynebacterium aquatimens]WJY66499.1 Anti-sigma factor RshA [Corynebacterium aquatimens]